MPVSISNINNITGKVIVYTINDNGNQGTASNNYWILEQSTPGTSSILYTASAVDSVGSNYIVHLYKGTQPFYTGAISKVSTDGATEWVKLAYTEGSTISLSDIKISNNNVYCTASTYDNVLDVTNYILIKANLNLDVIWAKKVSVSNTSSSGRASKIAIDQDENIYMSFTLSIIGSPPYDPTVVMKFSNNGNILWQKRFLSSNETYDRYITDLHVGTNGIIYSVAFGSGYDDDTDITALNTVDGSFVRRYAITGTDYMNTVTTDSDENIYIGGYNDGTTYSHSTLMSFTSSGVRRWGKKIIVNQSDNSSVKSLKIIGNNLYAAVGIDALGTDNYDVGLYSVNKDTGTVEYTRRIKSKLNFSYDTLGSLNTDANNNLLIGITTGATNAEKKSTLVKLPRDGSKTGIYGTYYYSDISITESTYGSVYNLTNVTVPNATFTVQDFSVSFNTLTEVSSLLIPIP